MRHEVLRAIGPISFAVEDDLERSVDLLIAESEGEGDYGSIDSQSSRAEALAILNHELRRRMDARLLQLLPVENF